MLSGSEEGWVVPQAVAVTTDEVILYPSISKIPEATYPIAGTIEPACSTVAVKMGIESDQECWPR